MSTFDADYLFVLRDPDDRNPIASPDRDTARKPFTFETLPLFTKPLVFVDGTFEYREQHQVPSLSPPPEVLFYGTDLLVKGDVRQKLLPLELPYLAIQPAIFIDHRKEWHEDYWYLTFLQLFDCWDRKNSTYDPEPVKFDATRTYEVFTYSLNAALLDKTPVHLRLLFKMGGANDDFVVVHTSIADHFRRSGAVLVPIVDYGVTCV